jgi:hypothetical protein
MTTLQRIRVVLKGRKTNVPLFLVLAQYIYASMTANAALFAASATLLATLASQIAAVTAAQAQVKSRIVGAAGARDAKRNALALTLESLRVQVQALCDSNMEGAIGIIQAAGMKAVLVATRTKQVLAATLGVQPGTVNLVAHAAMLSTAKGKKVFNWQFTVDGGKTWVAAPSTPYAKTTIVGLPSVTTCGFRVCVSAGSAGPGAWSQVLPTHLVEQLPTVELRAVA